MAGTGLPAAGEIRRLHCFNLGMFRQPRVRRILALSGYRVTFGRPSEGDLVGVWGHSPHAARGEAIAAATGARLVRVEDAFLRSLHPGRAGEPPLGLTIARDAVHFDGTRPSDLERLLASHPLDDTALLDRARGVVARISEAGLSKYAASRTDLPLPRPGYVLVIDQTRGDASIRLGGANEATFREMLYWAQEDHPGARILIRTHPETRDGHRPGHFGPETAGGRISLSTDPVPLPALLEGAVAVYVVSSQAGFEAILAGHRPQVFGLPFYAGWGLSDDRHPLPIARPRRGRSLTRVQLAAGCLLLYPRWYDPATDRLGSAETVVETLAARTRAWREDREGWIGVGMRAWKRAPLQQVFGKERPMRFADRPPETPDRPVMAWANRVPDSARLHRLEDGFLRSRGLGAALVPPLSLALDDLGIYYDAHRASRLEVLIAARAQLRPDQQRRAEDLRRRLVAAGLTKYNLGGAAPEAGALPAGQRILVPGQVEDDASIRLGCGKLRSNRDLLERVRQANPEAVILYKPHPDVEAGLRPGAVPDADRWADAVVGGDMARLLDAVDEVWTLTSLTGFEALLRGLPVTTLGAPFYAGWGLTRDLCLAADFPEALARRSARPGLDGLLHAALIDYPRYHDPLTGTACPVEVVLERLASGVALPRSPALRVLAKLQGAFATSSWLWRG